jgi:hypothetical protein
MYISLDTDEDCDPLHTRPLDREDAPWQKKLQLSWLQSKSDTSVSYHNIHGVTTHKTSRDHEVKLTKLLQTTY